MSSLKKKYRDDDSEEEYSEYSDEEDDTNKKDEKIERLQKENQRLERELKEWKGTADTETGQCFQSFGLRRDETWSKRNECSQKRNKISFYKFHDIHTESNENCYGCLMQSENSSSRSNPTKRTKKPVYSLSSVVCFVLSEALPEREESSDDLVTPNERIHFCKSCLDKQFYVAIQKYVTCTRLSHEFLSPSKFKEFIAKEKAPLLQLCNSDDFFIRKIDDVLEKIRIRNFDCFHVAEEASVHISPSYENEEIVCNKSVRTIEYRSGLYIGEVKIIIPNQNSVSSRETVLPDGQGTFHCVTQKPVLSYTGSWKNGLYHGNGELRQGKMLYDGNFSNGKKHDSKARVFFAGIEIFSGGFQNDLRHGTGISTSLCGTRKTYGNYFQGQKHDFFTTTQNIDGVEMTVHIRYRDNRIDAAQPSTITYSQKKYTGVITLIYPFLPDGIGTMVDDEKGVTYTGSWKHGKKNGKGRLEEEDRFIFGTWKEDLREGHFEVIYKISGEKEDMYFSKDMLVFGDSFMEREFWFEVKILSRVKETSPFSSLVSYRNEERSFRGLYRGESKEIYGNTATCKIVPHGKGTLHSFGQGTYSGYWYEGDMHGKGTFLVSGDYLGEDVLEYTGEYFYGTMRGYGIFKYRNGSIYKGTVVDNSPSEGILYFSLYCRHPLNDELKVKHAGDAQRRVDEKYEAIKVAYESKVQHSGYKKDFDEEKARWRAEQERSPPRLSRYEGDFSFHEFHGKGTLFDSWNNIIQEGRYDYGKLVSADEDLSKEEKYTY